MTAKGLPYHWFQRGEPEDCSTRVIIGEGVLWMRVMLLAVMISKVGGDRVSLADLKR